MNYENIYHSLCNRAKSRTLVRERGYEIHHILPTCLSGTNDKENLVKLTYKEHYLAHLLLIKMAKNTNELIKMTTALVWLCKSNRGKRITSSKMFEVARNKRSKAQADYQNEIIGPNGEKRAQLTRRINAPFKADQDIFHWFHRIYSEELLNCYQLSLKYPNLKGRSTNLLKVAHEERYSCEGWVLIKHKDRDFKKECREKMSHSAKNRTDKRRNQNSKLNNV